VLCGLCGRIFGGNGGYCFLTDVTCRGTFCERGCRRCGIIGESEEVLAPSELERGFDNEFPLDKRPVDVHFARGVRGKKCTPP
jgi:hypothetical protein